MSEPDGLRTVVINGKVFGIRFTSLQGEDVKGWADLDAWSFLPD